MKRKILIIFIGAVIFISMGGIAHAAMDYKLLESFPGFFSKGASPNLPDMILAVYKFGIWTVGIAGLFMLTIGGFWYMTSAGNNATAETAKKIIADSLLGIVAALGAYLIMYVINPDLTKINIAFTKTTMRTIGAPAPTAVIPDGGVCNGTSISCCKPGKTCTTCNSCVSFSNGYANLCYKEATGNTGCKLNSALASRLSAANLESHGAQVSEAWPPTVTHLSSCHADGTCADVRFTNGYNLEKVKEIYNAIKNVGLQPVFEYTGDCTSYTSAGIVCKAYDTQTSAASFHVNM